MFAKLLDSEYSLEKLRHHLQSMTYFNLKEAFTHMDYNLDGFLCKNDFRQFLQSNGVFNPTVIDIDGLFAKFDQQNSGMVSLSAFYEELSCKLPEGRE